MEGVAFSARLAFEALEASAGPARPLLQAGGGGMRSDRWCQLRADAFGPRPLRRMAAKPMRGPSAPPCAPAVGCGAIASLAAATERLVAFERTFEPDPTARAYYDGKFEKYQRAVRAAEAVQRVLTGKEDPTRGRGSSLSGRSRTLPLLG